MKHIEVTRKPQTGTIRESFFVGFKIPNFFVIDRLEQEKLTLRFLASTRKSSTANGELVRSFCHAV